MALPELLAGRCATGAPYGCLWARPVLIGGLAAEAAPTKSGAAGACGDALGEERP